MPAAGRGRFEAEAANHARPASVSAKPSASRAHALREQRLEQADAEAAGEMPSSSSAPRAAAHVRALPGLRASASATRASASSVRHRQAGEAVVAVPAARLATHETGLAQLREMAARGDDRRHRGHRGELARRGRPRRRSSRPACANAPRRPPWRRRGQGRFVVARHRGCRLAPRGLRRRHDASAQTEASALARRADALEAAPMALVDALKNHSVVSLRVIFRAVQLDARQGGARQRAAVELLGVGEYALVQRRLFKPGPRPPRSRRIEASEAQAPGQRQRLRARSRRAAPPGVIRSPSGVTGRPGDGQRISGRRHWARPAAGVEVGEAVDRLLVGRLS